MATPHPFVRPPSDPPSSTVAPSELATLRTQGNGPFLLDVRPVEERRMAHLVDDRHVPLSELPQHLGDLPRDRRIIVYDHRGSEARLAASVLVRAGLQNVAVLDGGLDAYARLVDPAVGRYQMDHGGLLLRQLPRPTTGCLAYFLGDVGERRAVIVDPGENPEPYRHLLREENWTLSAIVETHTHADHLAGHEALHRATGAPILVSRRSPAQYPHRSLADGEAVALGGHELEVLETPGHTRDHLTLRLGERIFTGDTLLIGGCGRTDLGDGDPNLLYESLMDRLLKLPDTTEVFPAHYGPRHALVDKYSSTLGVERATNEALQQTDRAAFLKYMTEGWPPKPADFDRIVGANLAPFPG